jgi:hypothetical protein
MLLMFAFAACGDDDEPNNKSKASQNPSSQPGSENPGSEGPGSETPSSGETSGNVAYSRDSAAILAWNESDFEATGADLANTPTVSNTTAYTLTIEAEALLGSGSTAVHLVGSNSGAVSLLIMGGIKFSDYSTITTPLLTFWVRGTVGGDYHCFILSDSGNNSANVTTNPGYYFDDPNTTKATPIEKLGVTPTYAKTGGVNFAQWTKIWMKYEPIGAAAITASDFQIRTPNNALGTVDMWFDEFLWESGT